MAGESSYCGSMACEQESGAGVADRLLDGENMNEKQRHSGASKPKSTEGPTPTGYSCNKTREHRERPQRGTRLVTL